MVNTLFNFFRHIYTYGHPTTGTAASADFLVNTTTGEICFSSLSQDCNLTHSTRYNFSITDVSGSLIFKNDESITESSCVTIKKPLLSVCSPFLVTVHPFNDNIVYNSVNRQITG